MTGQEISSLSIAILALIISLITFRQAWKIRQNIRNKK